MKKVNMTRHCHTCVCNSDPPEGLIVKTGYFWCSNPDIRNVVKGDPRECTCWRHQTPEELRLERSVGK